VNFEVIPQLQAFANKMFHSCKISNDKCIMWSSTIAELLVQCYTASHGAGSTQSHLVLTSFNTCMYHINIHKVSKEPL